MPRTGAAIRRAGALVALSAASALMGFPAVEARAHDVLALHAILLLGCATVLLSPAHDAVADLARRATEAARGTTGLGASARVPAGLLRWFGFAGIVLYALYVAGDVAARNEAAVEAEAAWPDTVKDFLLFLMFLVGVWAVYLSMIRGRGGPPPRPPAAEASPDRAGVLGSLPVHGRDGHGKGWPAIAAAGAAAATVAEEDADGGEVNAMAPQPECVVVDSKL